MKKLYVMLLIMMVLMMLMPSVMAGVDDLIDTAYDWEQLATVAGATAATLLIVQFIKLPIGKVWRIPTRAIVYVIALLIMIGARAFTAGLAVEDVPLLAINAFVVALAAMGSYELTFGKGQDA